MSNRSLIEFNHDYCPKDEELLEWAKKIQTYLHSGDERELPRGLCLLEMRHHSELMQVGNWTFGQP
jgi:hypothetical protein